MVSNARPCAAGSSVHRPFCGCSFLAPSLNGMPDSVVTTEPGTGAADTAKMDVVIPCPSEIPVIVQLLFKLQSSINFTDLASEVAFDDSALGRFSPIVAVVVKFDAYSCSFDVSSLDETFIVLIASPVLPELALVSDWELVMLRAKYGFGDFSAVGLDRALVTGTVALVVVTLPMAKGFRDGFKAASSRVVAFGAAGNDPVVLALAFAAASWPGIVALVVFTLPMAKDFEDGLVAASWRLVAFGDSGATAAALAVASAAASWRGIVAGDDTDALVVALGGLALSFVDDSEVDFWPIAPR